jgi:hypothetical protein
VGGSLTAYFADVAAVNAVNNNSDITLDMHFVKANAGISIDMPLITLGNGRPERAAGPGDHAAARQMAATGAKIDPNLDYTLSDGVLGLPPGACRHVIFGYNPGI